MRSCYLVILSLFTILLLHSSKLLGQEGTTVAGGNGFGTAANQIGTAYSLFVDAAGNIFIADPTYDRIQKWEPGATQGITVAGGTGRGAAANQLNYPTG